MPITLNIVNYFRLANSATADNSQFDQEQQEYEPDCFCLQPPNILDFNKDIQLKLESFLPNY